MCAAKEGAWYPHKKEKLRKLGNIRKVSAQRPAHSIAPAKVKPPILPKKPPKQQLYPSCSAQPHTQTRVSPKYPVTDCRCPPPSLSFFMWSLQNQQSTFIKNHYSSCHLRLFYTAHAFFQSLLFSFFKVSFLNIIIYSCRFNLLQF